jgi:hypothetical protein
LRRGSEVAISSYIHTFILPYQTRLLPPMQLFPTTSLLKLSIHRGFLGAFSSPYSLLKNAGASVKYGGGQKRR